MSSPMLKKKSKSRKTQKLVQLDEHSSTGREDLVDTLAVEEFNQNPAKPKHKKRKLEEDKDEHEKSPKRAKSEGFSGLVRFRLGGIQNNPNLEVDGSAEPSTSTSKAEFSSGKSPKKPKKHKSKALGELESTNADEIPSTSDDSNRKVKKKHSKKQNAENELAISAQSEIVETASVVEKEKKSRHKVKKQKELKPVNQSEGDQFNVCHDVQEANLKMEEHANDKISEVALKKKKKKAKRAKEDDSDVIFLENLFHDNELCTVYEKHKKRKKEFADANDNKRLKKGQLQDEGTSNLVDDKSGNATTHIKKTKKQRSSESNTSKSTSNEVVIVDELIRSSKGSLADSTLTTVSAKAKTKRTKIIDSNQKQKAIDDVECAANVEYKRQQPKQKKRRKVDVASMDVSMQSNSMHFDGKKSDSVLIQENVAASSKNNIKPSSSINANLKDNSISEIVEMKDGKSKKPKKPKKDNSIVKKMVEHGSPKDSSKEQFDSAGLVQDSVASGSSKVQDHRMSVMTNSDLQGTAGTGSSMPGKKKRKRKRKKSFTESNFNLVVPDVASSCVSAGKKQTLPVPVGDTTTVSNIENAQVSSKKKKKKRKKKKRDENNEVAGTSNDKGKLSMSDVKPVQSTKKLQVRKKLSSATNQLNTHLQLSPKSPLIFHKRGQHKKLKEILNKKVGETTQRLDETNDDDKVDKKAPCNDRSKHLQEKSWAKLNAARFRYLNEQMYTTTGQEAKKMFAADPDSYKVYQEGYKNQVKKWPINPVDIIIEDLKSK